jgi:hypothetical protein
VVKLLIAPALSLPTAGRAGGPLDRVY